MQFAEVSYHDKVEVEAQVSLLLAKKFKAEETLQKLVGIERNARRRMEMVVAEIADLKQRLSAVETQLAIIRSARQPNQASQLLGAIERLCPSLPKAAKKHEARVAKFLQSDSVLAPQAKEKPCRDKERQEIQVLPSPTVGSIFQQHTR